MTKMTGARVLAETLDGYGVTHVFFVPTILSRTLYELERRTTVTRVMTHGEKAAAYMADGYARASGRPGVCMAQTIGAANLAAGLRDAYMACSPVIALTGGPYSDSRHRHTYQEIEDFPLFRPVTKFSAHIESVDRVSDLLHQAFRCATTGKPGPVHLEFPGHLGEVVEFAESSVDVTADARFSGVPAFRPRADTESVSLAAELLARAERPVMIIGGGARSSGASREVVQLAEALQIPVATSLNAKDIISARHPLAVGVVGLYSRKSANRTVLEADRVFFVGSKTGSQVTCNWTIPPRDKQVIQLDIDPEELGRHYRNEVSLLGDVRATLCQLMAAVEKVEVRQREDWVGRAQKFVQEWRHEMRPLLEADSVPIRPERLCEDLSAGLPGDGLLVVDTGHAGMWAGGMIDLTEPDQGFIRAAGSLGWAFPASLGAKLARPDRPVILFTGDGGLWYHLSELETAVRWRINVVIVVNNNRSMNQEVGPYTAAYDGQLHGRHTELWHFEDIDFARVAESFGARGIRVTEPRKLAGAIEEGLSSDMPTVIDVVTDIDAMAPVAEFQ